MGMRASDARWLARNVEPFLRQFVNATPATPSLRTRYDQQAHELLSQLEERTRGKTATTSVLQRMGHGRHNLSVDVYRAEVDSHVVPYIEIQVWPCVWHDDNSRPEQQYPPVSIDSDYNLQVDWDGDWCWSVYVDDRFCYDFETREEVEALIPLVANAMAVAAGYTSHGPHSFPRNAHGPAVGLAFTDLAPATAEIVSTGWGPEAIADAVVERLRVGAITGASVEARVMAEQLRVEPAEGDTTDWQARAEQAEADAARLAEAIRSTREYIGADLLPEEHGWAWYDAITAHHRRLS